ncbi:MAG TPA: fumarylacetoacetate hydrolase family protein [Reyranella sp.]
MGARFGIVAFAVATPFGVVRRVGAQIDDGRVVDLRNAYVGVLNRMGEEPSARHLAAIRVPDSTIDFVRGGEASLAAAREAVAFVAGGVDAIVAEGEELQLAFEPREIRLLPAILPGKMVCAGRNYRAHQAEMGMPSFEDFPRGFIKVSSALAAHDEAIAIPAATHELDYEVELAVVIGRRAKDVTPETALGYVYGYTLFNDLSARDWQMAESRHGNHLLGKNLDGLGPLGPAIVPREFVADPNDLPVQLTVNGELRQNSRTSHMIFTLAQLISHWSKMTLEPGDVVATGTPDGVAMGRRGTHPDPFLKPGDIVEASIEGIGRLTTRLV